MKKWLLVLVILVVGCRGVSQFAHDVSSTIRRHTTDHMLVEGERGRAVTDSGLIIDGYGLGVHINRYGRAVQLRPDWGGFPGERLEIEEDAYGIGVHSDQYGRPVREYPWP